MLFLFALCGCYTISPPPSFVYQEIKTDTYKLASWQKMTDPSSAIRIYFEGDGYAFNHAGHPTSDPTPRGVFLRKIAFNDPNPNVVYLARPCQYVKDDQCSQKDWTTGRFSQKIVSSVAQAVTSVAGKRNVVLIAYSGGALLSGLVIEQTPQLHVQEWVTLAGLLNHEKWTTELKLPPLKDSLDLQKLPNVKQLHLIGDKDKTIPYKMTQALVKSKDLIVIVKATHNSGFEQYYSTIYQQ